MATALPALPPASGAALKLPADNVVKATHHLQVDLENMPLAERLELRTRIEKSLPVKDLKDVDLSRELVLQMLSTQELQADVMSDGDVPANQKAQTANAVATILGNLIKLQSEVYTSERLKKIEQVMVAAVDQFPDTIGTAFYAEYAALWAQR